MSEILTQRALREMVARLARGGQDVIGPVEVKPGIGALRAAGVRRRAAARRLGAAREFHQGSSFPRHETLYGYRIAGNDIELTDPPEAWPSRS